MTGETFHGLIQFHEIPDAATRARLARAGIRLQGYIPRNAYRAAIPVNLDPDDTRLEGVRSIVWLEPGDKIDPRLRSHRAGDVGVFVQFNEDTSPAERRRAVNRSRAEIVGSIESLSALALRLPARSVDRLAAEDSVAWIEEALPLLTGSNDGMRANLGVEGLWSDPIRGLVGTGIDVLVFDQGRVDDAHPDFGGRVLVGDPVTVATHSTHVAGTLAGDGTQSSGLYAGAAPGVEIISFALGSFNAGIFMYSNPGDLEADFATAIQTHGADLANLSLGSNIKLNNYPCSILGDYGITDALLDAIVTGSLGPRFPIVVAGGNERPSGACSLSYSTTAPPAGAKNVLSVGAIHSDDDTMTSFSAWGPTDDGRIKPDVVAPGCQITGDGAITSTFPAGTYGGFCGTSHGAPAVTGVLAQLLEDSRAASMPDPEPASLRALAYHTALDLGPPGPDYQFGYGRLRPREALDLLRAGAVQRDSVGDAQVVFHSVVVVDPNVPFTATLVWDDPPASAGAAVALVNDLDLEVTDPSGARRFPWTTDPEAPGLPAVQTRGDHVNNMEQVHVPSSGLTGLWRVEVRGSLVAVGPVQEYSLIITSGAAATPSDGYLTTDRPLYGCNDPITITLVDQDLAGLITTDVLATSTTDPVGIPVSLAEQTPPGTFTGGMGAGQLSLSHGDTVTITHAQTGPALADVDCLGPVLSEATVTLLDATSAQVTWLTDEPADTRLSGVPVTRAMTLQHGVTLTGLQPCTGQAAQISSADPAGNLGLAPPVVFETLGDVLHFQDDLESGAPGWQNPLQSGNQWMLSSSASASPIRSWSDSVGGSYQGTSNNGLISPSIDLSGARNIVLLFNHNYAMEEGFDSGHVQISVAGGAWSSPIASFSGISYGFVPARVELPTETENQPDVRIRFLLSADNSLEFDGWYIDDVTVVSRPDCSEVDELRVETEPTVEAPRLLWDLSPAAVSYNIYRGDLPLAAFSPICQVTQAPGPSFDDFDSDPNLSYYYVVTGSGGAGEGPLGFSSDQEKRSAIPCPLITNGGWTLARTISFRDPVAARFNPADGLIYVGRSVDPDKGLYRIEADGAATPLWTGEDITSIAIDPNDGDIFTSEEFKGKIFHTDFTTLVLTDWVVDFHNGDDDPVGMEFAPAAYTGSVLMPGEGLVVDRGEGSGPSEVWKWSPGTAGGETIVHADDGTFVEPLDVAATADAVYVVDSGLSGDGILYEVGAGGTLTELLTDRVIPEPVGITADPLTGDLFVAGTLDGGTQGVVRLDPATGVVTDVIQGLIGLGWGSVAFSPDGSLLIVTDGAGGRIYTFSR